MKKKLSLAAAALSSLLLTGCDWTLINPAGYVAKQQSNLMIFSVVVMLFVIVPVLTLIAFYAWKYRVSSDKAEYDPEFYNPDFYHSAKLELVIWGIPIAIIILLATVTWGSTHLLDHYRPLARIDSTTKIAGIEEELGAVKRFTTKFIDPKREDLATVEVKPMIIEVTALDWKWLFIYPEQGIATVNELAIPVNRPVEFRITSASMMNSFFIPDLAGQIYAMPGMQTRLHGVINEEGRFKGFSGNYTGRGFSQMYFYLHGLSNEGFDAWVSKVRQAPGTLDQREYVALDQLDQTNERGNVMYFGIRYYAAVQQDLFDKILNMCVTPGMMCANEMMAIDLAGGISDEAKSLENYKRLRYDKRRAVQTQLELAEFTDTLPGDYICTTDTIVAGLGKQQEVFPSLKQSKVQTSAQPSAFMQDQKVSLDTEALAPTL